MQVDFVDFVPEQVDKGGFFKMPKLEEMVAVVDKMNDWLERNHVKVVNIETVVLPNIHSPHEDGSQDTNLTTKGDFMSSWNQFIRVWYERA